MRVVFWGTPEFALPSLHAVLDSQEVVGVVTRPDRPAGRGRRLRTPPVKRLAAERGIPVLQPERPRGDEFIGSLAGLNPDISVVAAYGAILPAEALDLPAHGSINVHASLLPELRGAAPVNWAIIRGYRVTGVTIMRMVEELDAGPIILQEEFDVPPRCTAGALSGRLATLGASVLVRALAAIAAGDASEREQNHDQATYAPMLGADDARIDWSSDAELIDRWIRGCDPTPTAWSLVDDLRVRLFSPRVLDSAPEGEPGVVVRADPRDGLVVATGSRPLAIGEVQPAGKRRMNAVEWVRGRGIESGQRFR